LVFSSEVITWHVSPEQLRGFWGTWELQDWGPVWVCVTWTLAGARKERKDRQKSVGINPRLVEIVCEGPLWFFWLLGICSKGKCW